MMSPEFAQRFHRIKQGQQDLAERELAEAAEQCAAAEAAYREAVERRRAAQEQRNQSHSGAEAAAWQSTVQALEALERSLSHRLAEAQDAVRRKRQVVERAYVEAQKWESARDRAFRAAQAAEQARLMRVADEIAVLKFGRQGQS